MKRFTVQALALCLALLLTACPGTSGSIVITPTSATVTAPGAPVQFTATPADDSTTLTWSLSGPGSLSSATGLSSEYTPPTSVPGQTTAIVTVSGGGASRSATITIEPAAVINVAGKVLDLLGAPLANVEVRLEDAAGPKTPVLSAANGNFTVNGVVAPYTLSASPTGGADHMQQTWSGLSRLNPQLVMGFKSSGGWPSFCTSGTGRIEGSITPAVGAGNTATVHYLSEHLDVQELVSASSERSAGDDDYTIFASFDTIGCSSNATGRLIYIETDAAGHVVRTASVDNVFVQKDGAAAVVNLATSPAQSATLSGTVHFPPGLADALVGAGISTSGRVSLLQTFPVSAGSPDFSIEVPLLAGVQYRIVAIKETSRAVRWTWSESVAAGQSDIVLELGALSQQVSPSGTTADGTPTFTFSEVEGVTLYTVYLTDGADVIWLGMSSEPTVTMPELPSPAKLVSGGSYQWATLTMDARNAASIDDLLDGRMVKKMYLGPTNVALPSEVRSGSMNANFVNFSIP